MTSVITTHDLFILIFIYCLISPSVRGPNESETTKSMTSLPTELLPTAPYHPEQRHARGIGWEWYMCKCGCWKWEDGRVVFGPGAWETDIVAVMGRERR